MTKPYLEITVNIFSSMAEDSFGLPYWTWIDFIIHWTWINQMS